MSKRLRPPEILPDKAWRRHSNKKKFPDNAEVLRRAQVLTVSDQRGRAVRNTEVRGTYMPRGRGRVEDTARQGRYLEEV